MGAGGKITPFTPDSSFFNLNNVRKCMLKIDYLGGKRGKRGNFGRIPQLFFWAKKIFKF
jgi:hypothetical protein